MRVKAKLLVPISFDLLKGGTVVIPADCCIIVDIDNAIGFYGNDHFTIQDKEFQIQYVN